MDGFNQESLGGTVAHLAHHPAGDRRALRPHVVGITDGDGRLTALFPVEAGLGQKQRGGVKVDLNASFSDQEFQIVYQQGR